MKRREQLTDFFDHYAQPIAEGDILTDTTTGAYMGTVRWSDDMDCWVARIGEGKHYPDVPLDDLPFDDFYVSRSVYDTDNYIEVW